MFYHKNLVDFLEYGAVASSSEQVCFIDQDRIYTLRQVRNSAKRIGAAISACVDEVNRSHCILPSCSAFGIQHNAS